MKAPFKPMLISNKKMDFKEATYPLIVTKKYDGVRVEVTNKGLYNRSFKKMGNKELQAKFEALCYDVPEGVALEGEVYKDGVEPYVIGGVCNRSKADSDVDGYKIMLFDRYDTNDKGRDWSYRRAILDMYDDLHDDVEVVKTWVVNSYEELMTLYKETLDEGLEGLVVVNPKGVYHEGRVSNRMNIIYKLKPFVTQDLPILGVNERMRNTNESLTNELGHSYKRNTVDAKEGTGLAATFLCRLPNGKDVKVTITGSEDYRKGVWDDRDSFIGCYAEVESMKSGAKDSLRFPSLVRVKGRVEK